MFGTSFQLPGYGGQRRITKGDLKNLDDAVTKALTVADVMHVLRQIRIIDETPELLDLAKNLGHDWAKVSMPSKRSVSKKEREAAKNTYALKKLRQLYHDVLKFDLEHGTQTSVYIPEILYTQYAEENPERFAAGSVNNVQYGVRHRASLTSVLEKSLLSVREIFQTYNAKFEDAAFYDFGCGTGKPALYARMHEQFSSVTGIDYFEPILQYGEQNKSVLGLTDESKIRFECADVTQYANFDGDILVCYAYNPFSAEIMRPLVTNLENTGKPVVFLYNKPKEIACFESKNGWVVESHLTHPDEDQQLATLTLNMDKI